jgi:hypothetical protein
MVKTLTKSFVVEQLPWVLIGKNFRTEASASRLCLQAIQDISVLDPVLKTALSIISTLAAIIAALIFGSMLLGRALEIWELLLCGIGGVILTLAITRFHRRQKLKRLDAMRDSALW